MSDSIWYYVQTIKFMFSKDNPKSILYGFSHTGFMLIFLMLLLLSSVLGSLIFFLTWLIGFSYSYFMHHSKDYDIWNKTDDIFCKHSMDFCVCTYNNIARCFFDGVFDIFVLCLCFIVYYVIRFILQTCNKDLTESFEFAQTMTKVYFDKLNKNAENEGH